MARKPVIEQIKILCLSNKKEITEININSLRAPKKIIHAMKRNVLTLYSNERVCQITQQNILCVLIHPFVVMETVDEV